MSKELYNFLEKYKVNDSTSITHTSMGGMHGKYNIDDNKYHTFIDYYKKAINCDIDLYLVERNKEVGPVIIDIDFKMNNMHDKRQYTLQHIKNLIKKYNNIITDLFIVDNTQLISYVFEKDIPTKEEKREGKVEYKDGFHIYYPYISLDVKKRYMLYDTILNNIIEDNCFNDISYINKINEIIDSSIIINNGLLMYGSHKKNCVPYKLTNIFNTHLINLDILDYTLDDIMDITSLRLYDDDDSLQFKNIENYDIETLIYNSYNKTKTKTININNIVNDTDIINNTDNIININNIVNNTDNINNINKETIDIAKKLTNILSINRASKYDDWIRVGWVLYNIDNSLLEDFIKFSKRCVEKYEDGCCEKVWLKSKKNNYTIGTLYWWARNDNSTEYQIIISERIGDYMNKAKSGSHDDIANVIKEMYGHLYKCVSIRKNIWYEFDEHKWKCVEEAYTLSEKISKYLPIEFLKLNRKCAIKAEETKNIDEMTNMSKKIINICERLKDIHFKEDIIKTCRNKFYDKNFKEKLDSNIYILGFNNGVYDFETKCFRKGMPDDYLTFTVGYDYINYNENDDIIKNVYNYFETVQQNKEIRNYLLKLISTYLVGDTSDQKFIIWTGVGSNGKSMTIELIRKMLGDDYFGVMESSILTNKRNSSSNASPELANKCGKRFVVIQEPEHNDTIHVGQMKQLTGCDSIETRALYGDPFSFKPQFKLVLTCNKLPQIPSTDNGTWRRVRVTPWDTEFIDGEPTKKNQVKKDYKLAEKFDEWRSAFIWILINNIYPKYILEGLNEPASVSEHTLNYMKDSDIYLEFLSTHTKKENPTTTERVDLVFNMFKAWYKEAYTILCPPKKEFINYLNSKKYIIKKQLIYGISVYDPNTIVNNNDNNNDNMC